MRALWLGWVILFSSDAYVLVAGGVGCLEVWFFCFRVASLLFLWFDLT